MNKEKCQQAATLIAQAFDWSGSNEGHKYWSGVYDKLVSAALRHREPTLADLCAEVEVRDYDYDEWETVTLYGVSPDNGDHMQYRFFGVGEDGESEYYKQARIIV